MSADLFEQLAQYGADHRARQAPVERHEVLARVRDLTEPEHASGRRVSDRRRRRVLVAAAAAAALVVVALAVALRGGSDPDGVPADTVPERGTTLDPRSALYGVASNGSVLVAVGTDSAYFDAPPNADASAAVWTSTDGTTWIRVPHDEEVFGGPGGQAMYDVTDHRSGFVAVGIDRVDMTVPSGTSLAAVWTSDDGLRWRRAPGDDVFDGSGRQELRSIAVLDGRLVAIGFDEADQGPGRSNEDTAIWTSSDGVTWERVAIPFGTGSMETVLAADDGFIGLGVDNGRTVWTSPDGVRWAKTIAPPPEHALQLRRAIQTSEGYLGVSFDGDLWASPDGFEWARRTDARVFGDGTIFALTNHGSGIVAVGVEGEPGSSAAAARPLDPADAPLGAPIESLNALISSDQWSIIAVAPDDSVDVEAVLNDVSEWDAVVDVGTVDAISQDWAAYGIDACAGDGRRPCGAGLVVLTADVEIAAVAHRLIDDHGFDPLMNPAVADSVVGEYVEAITNREPTRPTPPDGAVEQPLAGPLEPWEPFPERRPLYSVIVRMDDRNAVFRIAPPTELFGLEDGPILLLDQSQQADEQFGRGTLTPVMAQPELGLVISQLDSGYVAIGGLPVSASIVVAEDTAGRRVWQEPIGGLALLDLSELPGAVVTVLDADGREILRAPSAEVVGAGLLQRTESEAPGTDQQRRLGQ